MNYYFMLLVAFYILTLYSIKKYGFQKVKTSKKYYIMAFLLLILFLILRSDKVGIDNNNYKSIFQYCHDLNFIDVISYERHEIGYKYYNKIISLIYYNFNFFMIITAILSMIGVYYFIKNNSKNYIYSLLIFITFNFYGFFFGIYRQVLAISILLYSLKFVKERQLKKFILTVFIASLFHKTALIFLIVYILPKIKINEILVRIWILLTLLFLITKSLIIQFILGYIYKPAETTGISGGGYKMLLLLFILSLVCYYYQKDLLKQDKNNIIFINMVFVATMIQCLSTVFGNAYRMTLYFSLAMIIIIPNILEIMKPKELKRFAVVLMFICLTMYYYYTTTNLINYVPYEFI